MGLTALLASSALTTMTSVVAMVQILANVALAPVYQLLILQGEYFLVACSNMHQPNGQKADFGASFMSSLLSCQAPPCSPTKFSTVSYCCRHFDHQRVRQQRFSRHADALHVLRSIHQLCWGRHRGEMPNCGLPLLLAMCFTFKANLRS